MDLGLSILQLDKEVVELRAYKRAWEKLEKLFDGHARAMDIEYGAKELSGEMTEILKAESEK